MAQFASNARCFTCWLRHTILRYMMWSLVPIFFLLLGLWFVQRAWRCRRQLRRVCVHGCLGTTSLALAAVCVLLAFNIHSYLRLTHEQTVARLSFRQLQPQIFQTTLHLANGETRHFQLYGDEWQLDARVLKWHNWAIVAGWDARYRLERLSGRYRDIEQERQRPRSVFDLRPELQLGDWPLPERWSQDVLHRVDLWHLGQSYPQLLPMVDAVYGSASYVPMYDGAQYEVRLSQSGLIARAFDQTE